MICWGKGVMQRKRKGGGRRRKRKRRKKRKRRRKRRKNKCKLNNSRPKSIKWHQMWFLLFYFSGFLTRLPPTKTSPPQSISLHHCFTPRATIITSTSHFSSLRTNEHKNDRLAKIKISSQPTGNLRAIAAHLSTAGKINNNIDSNLLFKCFYNMCFVTAPTLWKFSPPCTKILTFLCLHLCLSILLWFWDDILTKTLAPLPREAQHVLEEESSSYMQKT